MSETSLTDMEQREWNLKLGRMDADIANLRALTNKAITETDKALDESARIRAENAKIQTENRKLQTENRWHPWVVLASAFGAGAALFAAAVAFVKLFLS